MFTRRNVSEAPHTAYTAPVDVLDPGKPLEYPSIGEFQQIMTLAWPCCVYLLDPTQECLRIGQVFAIKFQQLPVLPHIDDLREMNLPHLQIAFVEAKYMAFLVGHQNTVGRRFYGCAQDGQRVIELPRLFL
jgi:hypothetical protein